MGDFGATDAPLTAEEKQQAPRAVHIPKIDSFNTFLFTYKVEINIVENLLIH